jgi:nucleotide-binding universal stress UspA family protein
MYKSIVVPLDGSSFAEYALPIARSIARRAGATLQLVHVHVPQPRYIDGKIIFNEMLDTQRKEQVRTYLDEMIKRLDTDPKFSITSTLLDGSREQIAEVLDHYVKSTNSDLIVMTTHGYGALTRFWIGSVADKLIRQTVAPILLMRPQETALDLAREQVFQHILIPLDGSALSEQILEYAVGLGKLMQANYTLLHALEPWIPYGYRTTEYSIRFRQLRLGKAQTYLDEIAERLRAQSGLGEGVSPQIQTKISINHYPAVAVLEEVHQHGIDLIAMATHAHGDLTRLLVGSVADKVLRGAIVPVLLHRPRGEASSN